MHIWIVDRADKSLILAYFSRLRVLRISRTIIEKVHPISISNKALELKELMLTGVTLHPSVLEEISRQISCIHNFNLVWTMNWMCIEKHQLRKDLHAIYSIWIHLHSLKRPLHHWNLHKFTATFFWVYQEIWLCILSKLCWFKVGNPLP